MSSKDKTEEEFTLSMIKDVRYAVDILGKIIDRVVSEGASFDFICEEEGMNPTMCKHIMARISKCNLFHGKELVKTQKEALPDSEKLEKIIEDMSSKSIEYLPFDTTMRNAIRRSYHDSKVSIFTVATTSEKKMMDMREMGKKRVAEIRDTINTYLESRWEIDLDTFGYAYDEYIKEKRRCEHGGPQA